jgi:pimeloyl-ACP methyl ester carboxylesterase
MKIKIILFALIFPIFSFAQKSITIEQNWVAFNQSIDVSNYSGMRFILEADIKTEQYLDSSGKAQMWVRVGKKDSFGFFDNMDDRPVTSNKWQTYKTEGKIDSSATKLFFGGLCYFSGKFYFDNFKLKVETNTGWKNLNIKNSDFENINDATWQIGTSKKTFNVKGFEMGFNLDKNTKNTSLLISASKINIFGNNKVKGKYFETNGVKLYYEIYGNGQPLLLLHGNGQSIEAFNNQIKYFKNKYKVIIPDCRGRGKSTDNDTELTYDIEAKDINNLLNELKIDSTNIIGWSDGGIIGLILAKDYPKKVKKLIASGANTIQDTTAFFPSDLKSFNDRLLNSSLIGINRKLTNLMVMYPNIPFKDLAKISCPTLIVAGDRDEIRIGHTIKIFESLRNGQLFIVPNSSHYLLSENHRVFNEAALKFLEE